MHFVPTTRMTSSIVDADIEEWLFSQPEHTCSKPSFADIDEADVVDAVEGVDYTMVPECKPDAVCWTIIAFLALSAAGGLVALAWWFMTKM